MTLGDTQLVSRSAFAESSHRRFSGPQPTGSSKSLKVLSDLNQTRLSSANSHEVPNSSYQYLESGGPALVDFSISIESSELEKDAVIDAMFGMAPPAEFFVKYSDGSAEIAPPNADHMTDNFFVQHQAPMPHH